VLTESTPVLDLPTTEPTGEPASVLDQLLSDGFSLDRLEEQLIRHAIEKAGGNKAHAARLLGITRRRLYSRLKCYGLQL